MKNSLPRSCSGFTLIEVLTVVAIVAIISAIAIPNYIEWSRAAKLRSAVNDLTSDLAMARLRAIKGGAPVKVTFTTDGYMVFIDDNDNHVWDSGEPLLRNKQYPAGVIMSGCTFTADRAIFQRTGASKAGEITLSRGTNQQNTIFVNAVGRIRVQ